MWHNLNIAHHYFRVFFVLALLVAFSMAVTISCKKKFRNYVDLEQINIDSSNNYRHIFKKTIEEERRKESRYRKNEFKD